MGVDDDVGVCVDVDVPVRVFEGDGVIVEDGVGVDDDVGVCVDVDVPVRVFEGDGVIVDVGVGVCDPVDVPLAVIDGVADMEGVALGRIYVALKVKSQFDLL